MARRNRRGSSSKGRATTTAIDPRAAEEAGRHYNRGMQLYQQGKLAQAESAYRQSIALNPSFPGSHNNLGNVLKDRGKFRLAEKAYRQALSLAPDHPMLLSNIGNVLFLQDRYVEGEEVLNQAIALDPGYFQAHSNLGNVLMALDRPGEAIKSYQRALEIDSSVPELFANLGWALSDQDRYHKACQYLEMAVRLSPDNADYRHKLGFILAKMHLLDEAEREIATACRLAPDEPGIRFHYAFALAENGRVEPAVEQLHLALGLDDAYTEAHCSLAEICNHTERDSEVQAMELLFNQRRLSHEQQANLAFGLGKAYDDMHEYAKAFDWFSKANSLARQTSDFDFEAASGNLRRIIAYFSRNHDVSVDEAGHPDATPIVITGMSRSGKSLAEKLLCLHPSVAPRGETNILQYLVNDLHAAIGGEAYPALLDDIDASSCAALARDYVLQLRADRLEQAHITDTHPINANYIGLLRRCLPEAKVIVCRRAAKDACISMFQKNYAEGHGYSNDQTDLGRSWALHEHMLDLWHELFPDTLYQVSFEALVRSPEEEAKSLLGFCEISCDDSYLDRVRDLVGDPRRWPRPEDVIDIWKPYEAYLSQLFAALEEQGH